MNTGTKSSSLSKHLIHFAVASFLFSSASMAQDLSIFDSRRPIAMSKDEKTYRDFYINGGIEQGVKNGMILSVKRRITLYDSYRANSPIEMMVDVGRIKIIHTQKGLSVARLYSKFSRKDRTILEHDFIMVGDKIDMTTALMETQIKRKSAEQPAPQKESPAKTMSKADFSSLSPMVYGPERPPVEMNTLQ
jgi:hypothetical protein